MRMQASLLASAALTAEVDMLKQSLKKSEQELGRAKKQLEPREIPCLNMYIKKVQLQKMTGLTWLL